jgi:hypothetical protein
MVETQLQIDLCNTTASLFMGVNSYSFTVMITEYSGIAVPGASCTILNDQDTNQLIRETKVSQ